ncbi:MAG: winged helix-turn-helix domain-containing protein [Clostridium sp.]|nr:winged helix-turn-helix domain-containing protein [Clostridium sp.]
MIHSDVFDFLASICRLNCNDEFLKGIKGNMEPNKDIVDWINYTKKNIPDKMIKYLNVFFNWETFYGMCLFIELLETKIENISTFLEHLKKMKSSKILSCFISSGFNLEEIGSIAIEDLAKKLLKDQKKAIDFINNTVLVSEEKKWELLQFFIYPDEMKKELLELLTWYYENIYIKIESKVNEKVKKYEKELIEDINNNSKKYGKIIARANNDKSMKTYISVSYFYEFAKLTSNFEDRNFYYSLIGYRYKEKYLEEKETMEELLQILKSIGDDTRLNIIKLLNERPYYGKEIAQKLKLSNSTISYHLSSLVYNNFITEDKIDNRVYYNFNLDNTKKMLCNAIDNYLNK